MKYLALFISLPIISLLIANFNLEKNNSKIKTINMEIFQLNFKNNDQFLTPEKKLQRIIKHIDESTAELLIFGENNFPYLLDDLELKIIKDSLKENQTLIIGATRYENNKYYNSLVNINSINITYFDKKILVPFGEFLPLRDSLTFLESIAGQNDYSMIDIEYTLQWKSLSTPIKQMDQIKVEYYPELNVTSISNASGKIDQEFVIGKFETSVNNYPFLVGLDEIDLITDSSKNYITYRLDPVKIKDTHKSYEFKILASSSMKIKEEISLDIKMNTTYLDQEHQTPPVKISVQLDTNFLYIFGLRYYYWLVILVAILVIAILIINYFRRANIYGFLIDVENNVIVDFSEIKRNPIEKMTHPKRINFKNIKQLPYNGGYFEFLEDEVYINIISKDGDPSIRINSVPVTSRESISQGQWIGSSGKQVRFNKNIPYMKI